MGAHLNMLLHLRVIMLIALRGCSVNQARRPC
jgi:hypothetical protein